MKNNNETDNKTIENLIEGTMKNLHNMVEANTIIGEPVNTKDGSVIIPISRVSVGYVVGGGEYNTKIKKKFNHNYPLTGGSGGGVTISPVGFLVTNSTETKYIDIENKTAYQTVLNIFNKIVDKFANKENNSEK